MNSAAWWAAAVAVLWAAAAFLVQVVAALRGLPRDLSRAAGSRAAGVAYNFTTAMMPGHKETARKHPVKFGLGIAMHAGALLAIAKTLALLVVPGLAGPWPPVLAPVFAVAFLSGTCLLVRRIVSSELRAISVPDDYLGVIATLAFIAAAGLHELGLAGASAFLAVAAAVFLYMPLGKLRHFPFFFVARFDYGRRLGYRAVYPARRPREGTADG